METLHTPPQELEAPEQPTLDKGDAEVQHNPEPEEKLQKGIKVVVGGPPHSGKSVFIEALSKNLDQDHTFAFSACPDGEGPWLQRHYNDPEVVKWRQKGQFTPEFVDRATRVVSDWEGPLMLIDIGGRTSEENAKIVQGATHAIILAGDLSKVAEWQDFFDSHGVEVAAVLHSHYHGRSDQVLNQAERAEDPEARLGRLTASVHYLERGEPAEDRVTVKEVAAMLHGLVEANTAYQEAHEEMEANHFVIDLPTFMADLPSETVEKTLRSGKVVQNRQLLRTALPALYEKIDKEFFDKPVWLDGPINSWEAIALASAFHDTGNQDIRMRGPDGFIQLKELPQAGQGDGVEWEVSRTGEYNGSPVITVHANVSASTRLLEPQEIETMHIPEVPEDSIVIISTAGPNWFRSSIALGYKDKTKAVAAFIPGEGSTIAWSQNKDQLGLDLENVEGLREISEEEYISQGLANLEATSRTARGEIDTSASESKSQDVEDLSSQRAAELARHNFTEAMQSAFAQKERELTNPTDVREFVENIAETINGGILKEGKLIRSGSDSQKYPYTRVAELEPAMDRFYQEFTRKLADPNQDPVELAAWVEYNIDLTHHFFADGCGKTAKVISSFVLMRSNKPLPNYTTRAEYYANAPTEVVGQDASVDKEQYDKWLGYYRTLF